MTSVVLYAINTEFLFPVRGDFAKLAAHSNTTFRPRLYFDSRDHALAGNEPFVAVLAGGGARLPQLRNSGAVAETTFNPAQINHTLGMSRRKIGAQLFFCARSISSFNARSLESRAKISVSASENLSVSIPI